MDDDIDCMRALHALYEFLDGELTTERRAFIELHLNGCPQCFSAFDFEAELRIVLRSRLRAEVPSQLMSRVAMALDAERARQGVGPASSPTYRAGPMASPHLGDGAARDRGTLGGGTSLT
jgi:anti-sigma factor (TIGR02949 family)